MSDLSAELFQRDNIERRLRETLAPFAGIIQASQIRQCQNCAQQMRGPICPHCGEQQAGYPYLR